MRTVLNAIESGQVVGKWRAESFDGKSPETLFIDSACLELRADGKCTFEVRMSEAYGCAFFPWGSGNWRIVGGVLEYHPDEGGDLWAGIELNAGRAELTLSPDPFIALEGETVRRGVYRRHA